MTERTFLYEHAPRKKKMKEHIVTNEQAARLQWKKKRDFWQLCQDPDPASDYL
jgi:hypothetical protein